MRTFTRFAFWAFSASSFMPIQSLAQSAYGGGTGEASSPYLIKSVADMQTLSAEVASGKSFENQFFRLENNLDFSQASLIPIGVSGKEFNGTFDGNGFVLDNLHVAVDGGSYGVGVFGVTGAGAAIKNLKVGAGSSIVVTGEVYYTGGVVGQNKGLVENCSFSGTVSGYRYVGGIVGNNASGKVVGSESDGKVVGKWFVGGIAGYVEGGASVSESINRGTVTGVKHVGGISGQANGNSLSQASIVLCGNQGEVQMTGGADGSYETMAGVGGVVGFSYLSTVERCYNIALVTSDNFNPYVGGIVGNNMDATVTDCYNTWNVVGSKGAYAGGIVGINKGEKSVVKSCYTVARAFADMYSGEICPENDNLGTVADCYFDRQTGASESSVGEGMLTRDLASGKALTGFSEEIWTFTADLYPMLKGTENDSKVQLMASPVILSASEDGTVCDRLDFVTGNFRLGQAEGVVWTSDNAAVSISGKDAVVTRSTDGDMKVLLIAQKGDYKKGVHVVVVANLEGAGTEENPFLIKNANQFRYFASRVTSGYSYEGEFIRLAGDIDLGGESNPYQPAGFGSGTFSGTFNGDGHTISGVYVNQPNSMNVGLFSRLSEKGTIKNLTVSDSKFVGSGSVGAIVGKSAGVVIRCGNHGKVEGMLGVGGIVGGMESSMTCQLTECFNTGEISSGRGQVGGIIGSASYLPSISHCFNSGKVTDLATGRKPGQTGGIAGYSSVPIEYCYNAGIITDLSDNESMSSAGGIVGRCYGSAAVPVKVTHCLNVGHVSTAIGKQYGPIVGIKAFEGDEVSDCYYDSQFCPTGENLEGATGLATLQLSTKGETPALGEEQWVWGEKSYPVLKKFEQTPEAWMASAAVFLSEGEVFDNVKSDFTVSGKNLAELTWWTPKSYTLEVDGNYVKVNVVSSPKECDIYASLGTIQKEVRITVVKTEEDAVDSVETGVAVVGLSGAIRISGAEGSTVEVCDLSGRIVARCDSAGSQEVMPVVSQGLFVVKVDKGSVYKVIVR